MNDLELDLKQLMADRAGKAVAVPEMRSTVRRARVRRVTNAGIATLAVVALTTLSVAGVQTFLRPDPKGLDVASDGYTTPGPYGFTSFPGDYPTIATGEFRGADWTLTAADQKDGVSDSVLLTMEIRSGTSVTTDELRVEATDDLLMTRHVLATEMLDGAHLVWGATIPGTSLVEVEVADGNGTSIATHRFSDPDSEVAITADYYMAFVPGDSPGFVHARDRLGTDIELEPYGDVSLAPHVMASGKTGDIRWSLEFAATQPDRFCLVFSTDQTDSECFMRADLEAAGQLLMTTFERNDVLGVVAVISDEVGSVQLELDGLPATDVSWFQPPQENLGEWPLRLVAFAVEPGTHGALQAYFGESEILAEEEF